MLMGLTPTISPAVTECSGHIIRIWTGDEGKMWLFMDNGVAAYTIRTDPDTKNLLAIGSVALVANKTLTIRFEADQVPCDGSTGPRDDVVGAYLNQ